MTKTNRAGKYRVCFTIYTHVMTSYDVKEGCIIMYQVTRDDLGEAMEAKYFAKISFLYDRFITSTMTLHIIIQCTKKVFDNWYNL